MKSGVAMSSEEDAAGLALTALDLSINSSMGSPVKGSSCRILALPSLLIYGPTEMSVACWR